MITHASLTDAVSATEVTNSGSQLGAHAYQIVQLWLNVQAVPAMCTTCSMIFLFVAISTEHACVCSQET